MLGNGPEHCCNPSETTYTLGNTLGNDGNRLDLGELEELHCRLVYGSRRGEVDDGVDICVLGNGLADVLVDGQQSLAGSPVPVSPLAVFLQMLIVAWHAHFAHELAAECVDDTGDRGLLALADEVEVEHALHGTGLQSARDAVRAALSRIDSRWGLLLDEASCLRVEEGVCGGRAHWAAGSCKTADVVVGRQAIGRGALCGRHGGRGASGAGVELQTNVSRVCSAGLRSAKLAIAQCTAGTSGERGWLT